MNVLKLLIIGICATAAAGACATKSSSSGSNSNWLACERDEDCRVVGSDSRCSENVCTRSALGNDAGPFECNARANAIAQQVVDLVDNPSNKACSVDADCVEGPRVSCVPGCGGILLSKEGAVVAAPQVMSLEREVCPWYLAAGCPVVRIPCPNPGVPICDAGICLYSTLTLPRNDAGVLTCDGRTQQLGERVYAATNGIDRTCANDGECTNVALSVSCYDACTSGPVSTAGGQTIGAALAEIEQQLCPGFDAAGCTSIVPPCPPPLPVHCVANQCEMAP